MRWCGSMAEHITRNELFKIGRKAGKAWGTMGRQLHGSSEIQKWGLFGVYLNFNRQKIT